MAGYCAYHDGLLTCSSFASCMNAKIQKTKTIVPKPHIKSALTAFTLIELLVVIFIITVIAALLLPVLAKAKNKAQQTICLNNLHQMALGVTTYAADNNDAVLPVYSKASTEEEDEPSWQDQLAGMLNSSKTFLCPADPESTNSSFGVSEDAFPDLNDTNTEEMPPRILTGFRAPANIIGLGDLGTEDNFVTRRPDTVVMLAPSSSLDHDDDDSDSARPSTRHSNRCDLEFMDGHVESLRLDQFYTMQTPADKWFDQNATVD